jgi:hypothetical protein
MSDPDPKMGCEAIERYGELMKKGISGVENRRLGLERG